MSRVAEARCWNRRLPCLALLAHWALLALTQTGLAQAASFNCEKAKSYAEKTVCADPLLSKLDEALSSNYQLMLAANTGVPPARLRQEQRLWQRERDQCSTPECLRQAYAQRIDETCDYAIVSGVHPLCQSADALLPKPAPQPKSSR